MARVWYCATCGYEVHSKGRCHNCGERLVASALPELEPLPEEDEVGYRLDGWVESDRARLIVSLNGLGVAHRFEDEELVVEAADEARVDDLVASLADGLDYDDEEDADSDLDAASSGGAGDAGGGVSTYDFSSPGLEAVAAVEGGARPVVPVAPMSDAPDGVAESVVLLASAAARLRADPTDMQADGDVAEASTSVFMLDAYDPLDVDEWSAVGRVTRKLLSLLGAEEALEDGIRDQAAILEKLLAPIVAGDAGSAGGEGDASGGAPGVRTVYELPEWAPEQRAQLGVLLDRAGVVYGWDDDELLVPSDREDEAEALFGLVDGVEDEEGDEDTEARYEAVAELFAATGRLAGDPTDEDRRAAVVEWFERSDGPPLLGMDDVDWYRIVNRAKSLVAAIEEGDDDDRIHDEANDLHGLLRSVV